MCLPSLFAFLRPSSSSETSAVDSSSSDEEFYEPPRRRRRMCVQESLPGPSNPLPGPSSPSDAIDLDDHVQHVVEEEEAEEHPPLHEDLEAGDGVLPEFCPVYDSEWEQYDENAIRVYHEHEINLDGPELQWGETLESDDDGDDQLRSCSTVDPWLQRGLPFRQDEVEEQVRAFLSRANLPDSTKKDFFRLFNGVHTPEMKVAWDKRAHLGSTELHETEVEEYYIFDVAPQIERLQASGIVTEYVSVALDGGQLYKSNTGTFWPCIATFIQDDLANYELSVRPRNILAVGLSKMKKGSSKPSHEFVAACFAEVKKSGLSIPWVVCDLPARSWILNHVSHASYKACMYCNKSGSRVHRRAMTFSDSREGVIAKTAKSYAGPEYDVNLNGIVGPSPLLGFVDLPAGTPVDLMHVCGQGICKRMLEVLVLPRARPKTRTIVDDDPEYTRTNSCP